MPPQVGRSFPDQRFLVRGTAHNAELKGASMMRLSRVFDKTLEACSCRSCFWVGFRRGQVTGLHGGFDRDIDHNDWEIEHRRLLWGQPWPIKPSELFDVENCRLGDANEIGAELGMFQSGTPVLKNRWGPYKAPNWETTIALLSTLKLVTSASLLVTSALLVVTRSY